MSVWYDWSCQLILLFNLFFLLFMSSTALFCTIYGSYCTISTNIYLYLQYFQQKVFNFSKISGSQTDPQSTTSDFFLLIEYFEISNTFDKSWLWLPLLTCHVKIDGLVLWALQTSKFRWKSFEDPLRHLLVSLMKGKIH